MPSKIQLDENLWFLYICLQKSDLKTIDFAAVGASTNLKPPAARMRYTRLRRQIESGTLVGSHGMPYSGPEASGSASASPSALSPSQAKRKRKRAAAPSQKTPPAAPTDEKQGPREDGQDGRGGKDDRLGLKTGKAEPEPEIKTEPDSDFAASSSSSSDSEDEMPLAKLRKSKISSESKRSAFSPGRCVGPYQSQMMGPGVVGFGGGGMAGMGRMGGLNGMGVGGQAGAYARAGWFGDREGLRATSGFGFGYGGEEYRRGIEATLGGLGSAFHPHVASQWSSMNNGDWEEKDWMRWQNQFAKD